MGQFDAFKRAVGVLVASGGLDTLQRLLNCAERVLQGDQAEAEALYHEVNARWVWFQVFGSETRKGVDGEQ